MSCSNSWTICGGNRKERDRTMSGATGLLNAAGAAWWPYVFHAAWQAGVVGVLVLGAVWALRRRSAPLRYGLLLVALAKFAIPPMLALPVGAFFWLPEPARIDASELDGEEARIAEPAAFSSGEAVLVRPEGNETFAREGSGLYAPPAAARASSGPVPRLNWRGWLLVLHAAGVFVMAGWMLWALAGLRRLLAQCRPVWDGPIRDSARRVSAALGMRGDVEVMLAPGDIAPMAVGLFRPSVVLPESMAGSLNREALESVLAHELAHLRRRDAWVLALENILLSFWWFNPLAWMVVNALRRTREDCCDDLVLSLRLADEHTYCRSLVSAASAVARPAWSPAILGFADRMHPLGRRLTRLMDTTLRKPHRLSLAGAAVLVLLAALALPGLRTVTAGVSTAAVPSLSGAAAMPGVDEAAVKEAYSEIPGKVVFHGTYRHRSRGSDIPEPGELWLKQTGTGAIAAITHLPFMHTTEIARGDETHRIVEYTTVRDAQGDNPGYRIELKIGDGEVRVTRRNVREDWDDQALPVPEGALFDPNSRPDPYAAANILLRGLQLAEGERKELAVYDWDNSGNAMAGYTIGFRNAGREEILVPAGKFQATHIVLQQVTSADTWFKKRAEHITDFWMLDNGVIVRIVRHREPYELELLEWTAPEELPGYLGRAAAAPFPAAPSLDAIPGEVAFKGTYKHFSRGREAGLGEMTYKVAPDGGWTVWSELKFYPSVFVAVSDAAKRLHTYLIYYPSGQKPGYHAEYVFDEGTMRCTKVQEGQSANEKTIDAPAGASFDPNTRPDPYCVAPILLAGMNLAEGESRELDLFDTDYTGEGVERYRARYEHKGKERIGLSTGHAFDANHIVLTQLSTARTWFKKAEGHVTDFWVLDNGVIVRIYRHREPYEVVLQDWSAPAQLPGAAGTSQPAGE